MVDKTGNDRSFATRYLDNNPSIRRVVSAADDFVKWKSQFPTIVIDNIKFYLMGGPTSIDVNSNEDNSQSHHKINPGADQLQEEDDLILLWARKKGMVSNEDSTKESQD